MVTVTRTAMMMVVNRELVAGSPLPNAVQQTQMMRMMKMMRMMRMAKELRAAEAAAKRGRTMKMKAGGCCQLNGRSLDDNNLCCMDLPIILLALFLDQNATE
jgi:hypothetical protein